MAALTVTLCIIGGLALIGTSGAIWYSATEDDRQAERDKQRVEALKAENEQLAVALAYVKNLQTHISNAQSYLAKSKQDFTNGGHVYEGEPLAKTEFDNCEKNLSEAYTRAGNLITDLDATITRNTNEINSLGG